VVLHNGADLRFRHVHAQLLHGVLHVDGSDLARVISVKLIEDGKEFLLVEEVIEVDGGTQELRVIYLAITRVVHLLDDIVYLLIRHFHVATLVLQYVLQLCMSDHAGLIFVHLFKLTLEMFYFLVIRHLYKHIHCSAFEKTLTFVALQSFNDINVKSDLICL